MLLEQLTGHITSTEGVTKYFKVCGWLSNAERAEISGMALSA
jgi:hypothetical protein